MLPQSVVPKESWTTGDSIGVKDFAKRITCTVRINEPTYASAKSLPHWLERTVHSGDGVFKMNIRQIKPLKFHTGKWMDNAQKFGLYSHYLRVHTEYETELFLCGILLNFIEGGNTCAKKMITQVTALFKGTFYNEITSKTPLYAKIITQMLTLQKPDVEKTISILPTGACPTYTRENLFQVALFAGGFHYKKVFGTKPLVHRTRRCLFGVCICIRQVHAAMKV